MEAIDWEHNGRNSGLGPVRILAVFMCATLLVYGANERNDFLVRDSLAALHRIS